MRRDEAKDLQPAALSPHARDLYRMLRRDCLERLRSLVAGGDMGALALLSGSLPAMIFPPPARPCRWFRCGRSLHLYTTGSPTGEAAVLAVVVACCALPVALHGLFMRL
jgi:hypothetical protein